MNAVDTFENFPPRMILIAVIVNVSIYALGAWILSGLGPAATILYVLYCIANEVHIMKKSCVDCYYYGRWCSLGRGKLAPLLFKKGEPARFVSKAISWKDLLPDMLVLILPLLGGTFLLVRNFSLATGAMMLMLVVLSLSGNYLVRSRIACKYCKQRELGCPAQQLFGKNSSGSSS